MVAMAGGWAPSAASQSQAPGSCRAAGSTRSFAVVKVADYPGLTVMLDHQPIRTTDEHGRVLIDRVRAYELNQVSLDPREIPFDAELQTATMTVTPAWRSGPVVAFPIERVRAATLRLVLEDGRRGAAGSARADRGAVVSVALDGFTYVSGLGRAGHRARAVAACTVRIRAGRRIVGRRSRGAG